MIAAGTLVSMTDIAMRAEVRRPAVTNWRRRHPDFPAAVRLTPQELFEAEEIATWLDGRPVSAKVRRLDEPPGTTFGDRFRQSYEHQGPSKKTESLVNDHQVARSSAVKIAFGQGDRKEVRTRRIAVFLLDWLWRLRDIGDTSLYADLLLAMFYLRISDRENWSRLVAGLRSHGERQFAVTLEATMRLHIATHPDRRQFLQRSPWLPAGDAALAAIPELIARISSLDDSDLLEPSGTPEAGRELAGLIYREMLDQITEREGHRGGEFLTPRPVADLVASLVARDMEGRLHDPCCGAGELLIAAASRLEGEPPVTVSGSALSPRPHFLAGINLALHDIPARLTADALADLRHPTASRETFDRIVSNPPFNMSHWTDQVTADPRWAYGIPSERSANFAWLQHIASQLSPRGRAAVVMSPSSTFSSNGAEHRIRKGMVEDGLVACVIELPRGLFSNTGIPVTVWVLEKGRSPGAGVLLIDASGVGAREFGQIAEIYDRWSTGRLPPKPGIPAREFTMDELRVGDYSLGPRSLLASWVSRVDQRDAADLVRSSAAKLTHLARRSELIDAETTRRMDNLKDTGHMSGRPLAHGRLVRLAELCTVQMGPAEQIPKADDSAGVPVVTARQIKDRRIQVDGLEYATSAFAASAPQYRLGQGDLVCVRTGMISRTALVDEEHAGWLLGRGCLRLRPGDEILPSYLLHYLSHPQVVEWVLRSATSSVLPTISVRKMRDLPVLVPPLSEQAEIVALLDALDEKIAAHSQIVRATREMHASALGALLGDLDPAGDVTP